MALLFLLPQFPFFLRKGRTFRQRAIINIVTGQIKGRNVFIFPKVFGWGVEKEARQRLALSRGRLHVGSIPAIVFFDSTAGKLVFSFYFCFLQCV